MCTAKLWNRLNNSWKAGLRFFAISEKELLFLILIGLLLLIINYGIIAFHGFSLSYSKSLPSISVLKDTIELIPLLFTGHILFRRSPWYLWSVVTIHFLVLFLLVSIYVTTGTFFCESVLYLVYDTNWAETKDFCKAYLNWKNMILLLVIPGIYFLSMHFLLKLCKKTKKYSKGDLNSILLLIFLSIPLLLSWNNSIIEKHPFYRIFELIRRFHANAGAFTYQMRHRTVPDFVTLNSSFNNTPPVGILVIGESAIRNHHGIYGYTRNTTPNLLRHKENIILFQDMITVLPLTITALKYWLTDMTLQNRYAKWTVFDALKKSGYQINIFRQVISYT